MLFYLNGVFWNVSTYPKEQKKSIPDHTGTFRYAIHQVRVEHLDEFPVSPWRIMSKHNSKNKAVVEIVSKSLKEKDGTDKVMYNQETDVDVYPPDFGMAGNFQPYDISFEKTYESQKKTVSVSADVTDEIVMC